MRKHIQTTLGASDVTSALKPVQKAVASYLRATVISVDQMGKIYIIPPKNTMADDIPPLVHPMVFDSESNTPYMVMDLRHIRGRISTPFISELVRAYLTLEDTAEPNIETLYRIEYRFVGVVFVKLLSTLLTRTYGLNPDQQTQVSLRIADYYTCMLKDRVSKNARRSFINKLIRVGEKPLEVYLNNKEEYHDLRGLCDELASGDISPKMKRITPGLVLTIVSGISYGTNIKPIIATSMEYPPYFNYLVYTAIHNIAYRNSLLVKIVETTSKSSRDAARAYIEASKLLTRNVSEIYSSQSWLFGK